MSDREPSRLGEIAWAFLRLGVTAFGGPMAHLALMEDELVTRRRWCDREQFLDAAAAVNFIPGPNSTELAIYLGYVRGGVPGLIVAGVCFITPAVLIILPIAFAYVRYGSYPQVLPVLHTVSAAIVAIIAVACVRLARSTFKSTFSIVIASVAFVLMVMNALHVAPVSNLLGKVQPEIVLMALAAIAGIVHARGPIAMAFVPAMAMQTPTDARWLQLFWSFLKIGATLFGSGYVLASYLRSDLVDRLGWLTPQQLADAIAVGQFTPGPLLTTATFIGYVVPTRHFGYGDAGGVAGALLATLAIFLPSFLLVLICGPVLNRIRGNATARSALDAMNAAVVGLIAFTVMAMAHDSFGASGVADWLSVLVALISAALMGWRDVNATWVVLLAGCVGAVRVAWNA